MTDPICPECGFPQSEWATFCQHNFGRLQAYVAEYVNDSPATLRARLTEAQSNTLEMARKAEQAERRAEEAEFHVEQLRDARDAAERRIERIEARAVELATERDAALARIARTNRLLDAGPDDPAIHRLIRRAREALNSSPSVEQAHIEMCGSVTLTDGRKVPGCWIEPARGDDGDMNAGCPGCECGEHQWLDRPESDTRECLICGTEVAG